jgi:tryptophan-rich sensory protein
VSRKMALGGLIWLAAAVWLLFSGVVLMINIILIEMDGKKYKGSKYSDTNVGSIFKECYIMVAWCVIFPLSGLALIFIWQDAIGHIELGGTIFLTDEAPSLNLSLYDACIAMHFVEMVLSVVWTYLFFYKKRSKVGLLFAVLGALTAITVTALAYILSIVGGILYTLFAVWTIFEVGINIAYLVQKSDTGIGSV